MDNAAKKMLDDILVKPIGTLDEYDRTILRARRGYLTDKQLADYADVFKEVEEETESTEELGVSQEALERGEAMSEEEKQEAVENSVPIEEVESVKKPTKKKSVKKK